MKNAIVTINKYKSYAVTVWFIMSAFVASPVYSYVPDGSHLVYLMCGKLHPPKTLKVFQTLVLPDETGQVTLEETLYYGFTDKFRSDVTGIDNHKRIFVLSPEGAVIVSGQAVVSEAEPVVYAYKDLLLYRDFGLTREKLKSCGIDVETSSLGRFDGRVAYVVGAAYPDLSVPQLWIDKTSFRPTRLILKYAEGAEKKAETVEVRYRHWRKFQKYWYPMRIEIFVDDRLDRFMEVTKTDVNPVFSTDLFSVEKLKASYPSIDHDQLQEQSDQGKDELNDVRQTIDNFKKMYEHD